LHARIDNPALAAPGPSNALQALGKAATKSDLPETTVSLAELRTSQIDGCGVCVDMHSRELKNAGDRATASLPSPSGGMSRI
jgi:AhpD family alkylhydroperoxidase